MCHTGEVKKLAPVLTIFGLLALGVGFYLLVAPQFCCAPRETATSTTQSTTSVSSLENLPGIKSITVAAKLGVPATVFGLTLTPLEVIEDSRCPANANCIQAGTVRVRMQFKDDAETTEQVVTLGQTATTAKNIAIFKEVQPESVTGQVIDPKSYKFVFRVERR